MENKLEKKIDDLTEAVAAGFTNLENNLGGKLDALENKVDVRTNAITKRLDVITDDLRVIKTIKTTLPSTMPEINSGRGSKAPRSLPQHLR